MSCSGWVETTSAGDSMPSAKVSSIDVAPSMTWRLVRMSPSALTTTPLPRPLPSASCRVARSGRRLRSGRRRSDQDEGRLDGLEDLLREGRRRRDRGERAGDRLSTFCGSAAGSMATGRRRAGPRGASRRRQGRSGQGARVGRRPRSPPGPARAGVAASDGGGTAVAGAVGPSANGQAPEVESGFRRVGRTGPAGWQAEVVPRTTSLPRVVPGGRRRVMHVGGRRADRS